MTDRLSAFPRKGGVPADVRAEVEAMQREVVAVEETDRDDTDLVALRDHFARECMKSSVAAGHYRWETHPRARTPNGNGPALARAAYELADAMIAARSRHDSGGAK